MDNRERYESTQEMLLAAMRGLQADMWTSMPGIVQSFDHVERTCVVRLALTIPVTLSTGVIEQQEISLLLDCPVVFPSGGGYTLTFPIANNDECLVVFSSRCIDAWWDSGRVSEQHILRMHDLSDGFVFVGVNSKPKVIANISTNSTQLRSDAGTTYVELKSGTINIVAPTAVVVTAPSTTVNSATVVVNSTNSTVNASAVATVVSPSIILKNSGVALKKLITDTFISLFNNHVHSGVLAGGANTGTPTTTASAGANATSIVQAE